MFEKFFTITFVFLLAIGGAGCGGGGGSSSTPESPGNQALQVSPSNLSQTVLLGSASGTATITLTNNDNSGNAFTVSTNSNWIALSSTSGTVAANSSTEVTLTFTCTEKASLSGTVTVTGSNGTNDVATLTISLTCDAPPLEISLVATLSEARVLVGELAATIFSWQFTSPWSGQGEIGYTITSVSAELSISNDVGVVQPSQVVQHDLEYSCGISGRNTNPLTITIGDDDTSRHTWEVACVVPEQESIWIRMYQGVLVVEIRASTNDVGESYYTLDQSTRLLEDRVTYVSVVVNHADLVPPEVEVAVIAEETETLLDDQVTVLATPPVEGETDVWTTEFVFDMPIELVDEELAFQVRLDPNDLIPEENENNNNHHIDYASRGISVVDSRYRPLEIVVLPIIGEHPAPEEIVQHSIYDIMKDLLPITDYSIVVGETIDMSQEDWDIDTALQEVSAKRLESANPLRHFHGLFIYENGVSGHCGLAYIGGWTGVSALPSDYCSSQIFAHEIGHNLSLRHAPSPDCPVQPSSFDQSYPYEDGSIGDEFGWLISSREFIVSDTVTFYDLMSYCPDRYVSQYHFSKGQRFWESRSTNIASPPLAVPPSVDLSKYREGESLILMGAILEDGSWSLNRIKHLQKAHRSLAPTDSPYTLNLKSARTGATLYSEPLEVNEIDHIATKHWSAVVPVTVEDAIRVVLVDENKNTVFAKDLNW